jgi:hypothetical protein
MIQAINFKFITLFQFQKNTNSPTAVADEVEEEEEEDEEVVFVPVLGSNTALCCNSPPLCIVSAGEGMDIVAGVVAVG